MSNRSIISISSDDDNNDNYRNDRSSTYYTPQGDNVITCLPPLSKNTLQNDDPGSAQIYLSQWVGK